MNNPYETLEIDKKADKETIKKAYKRKAKETHPDKGGDNSKFNEVTLAYKLLINDESRDYYDKTGETDYNSPDKIREEAKNLMVSKFISTIQEKIDIENFKVDKSIVFNPITITKGRINGEITETRDRIENIKVICEYIEKIKSKISIKKNKNPILILTLEQQILTAKQDVVKLEREIEIRNIAIEMISQYKFQTDFSFKAMFKNINFDSGGMV